MGSLIATLFDDFADGTIAQAWSAGGVLGSATRTESGGQALFTLPSSTAGAHDAWHQTAYSYDLTAGAFAWTIGTMVATGVAATAYLDLRKDSSNYYRWRQVSGTLTARKVVAGVDTQLYTVAWNATTYKYLRIREASGTVYFDSSSNGTSWTNRATTTVSGDFAVTDLYPVFGAACGNVASPGSFRLDDVNLSTLATTWRWVEGRREYQHRIGSVSLAATAGVGYLAIASSIDASGNLVSPRYFAGPQTAGEELTEQSSQAAAQTLAVPLPLTGRWYLPRGSFVEGRYVRLYVRATSGSFTLREFYPRRYIQADDIEAESIRSRLIAAGAVTADKISVLQLSAITADMGVLTAGRITGATINSANSGARWEGNSTRLFGTDGTTTQWEVLNSTGQLTAGAGAVKLSSAGLTLEASASVGSVNAIRWYSSGTELLRIDGFTGTQNNLYLWARRSAAAGGTAGAISLVATDYDSALNTSSASFIIQGKTSSTPQYINMLANDIAIGSLATPAKINVNEATNAANRLMALNTPTNTFVSIESNDVEKFVLGYQTSPAGFILSNSSLGSVAMMITSANNYVSLANTTPSFRLELPNIAGAAGEGRANSWTTYSSATRKKNIKSLARAQTRQLVQALRSVSFDWDSGGSDIGLIAEEVLEVAPGLVAGDPAKPETLGLRLDRVALLLLPIVQELIEEVTALKRAA